MSREVLTLAPQYLGNLKHNLLFSTASSISVITWCIVVSVDLPGFRQIVIDVGVASECFNSDIPGHQFLHRFLHERQ